MNRIVAALGNHPRRLTAAAVVFMAGVGWLWLIVADDEIHAWRPVADGFEPVALIDGSL